MNFASFKTLLCTMLCALHVFAGVAFGLQERILAEESEPFSTLTGDSRLLLKSRHVVFVDGIMNGLASIVSCYFDDNISAMRELSLESDHLAYSSRRSIEKNALKLSRDLEAIYARVQKPLIVIAHSKGGAELLLAIFHNFNLLDSGHVEKVVLVEGAVGGSPLALRPRSFVRIFDLHRPFYQGLKSLDKEQARPLMARAYMHFQNALWQKFRNEGEGQFWGRFHALSKRVFYVRVARPAQDRQLSFPLRLTHLLFQNRILEGSQNDGVIDVNDQILGLAPYFGVDLGILEGDHLEYVIAGACSRGKQERRYAFSRALLSAIYHPDIQAISAHLPRRVLWDPFN